MESSEKVTVELKRSERGDVIVISKREVTIEEAPDLVRHLLATLAEFTIARSTAGLNFWESMPEQNGDPLDDAPRSGMDERDPPTGLRWHRVSTGNYAATLPSGRQLRVTNDHGRWIALDGDKIVGVATKKRIAQVHAERHLMNLPEREKTNH